MVATLDILMTLLSLGEISQVDLQEPSGKIAAWIKVIF